MNKIHPIKKKKEVIAAEKNCSGEAEPYIRRKYKLHEKSGHYEVETVLSDGSDLNPHTFKAAVKRATGATDPIIGEEILKRIARGFSADEIEVRFNEASSLLPALHPQDETEAMLLGQFLALQDSGMKCLRHANLPEQGFYHQERFFILAQKLFNTANQTMQTLLKYRSGGQQTMQVIHFHNEGQAIVAQNLSSSNHLKGQEEKFPN